uniref:F-box domain-containing protein n=1 Tax=Mycena chlorophos TaxID=658473 RepID=A0ABQ0LCH2_MYCCL|nr:predicted protein [Mycena chlorophos]
MDSFTTLPSELLTLICHHVPNHTDLLSLSLVSQRLSTPAQTTVFIRRGLCLRSARRAKSLVPQLLSQLHLVRSIHSIRLTTYAFPLSNLNAFVALRHLVLWTAEPAHVAVLPSFPALEELLVVPRATMRVFTKTQIAPVFSQHALRTLTLGPIIITSISSPWPASPHQAPITSLTLVDASVARAFDDPTSPLDVGALQEYRASASDWYPSAAAGQLHTLVASHAS